jgi:hypothetical protein
MHHRYSDVVEPACSFYHVPDGVLHAGAVLHVSLLLIPVGDH